MNKKVSIFFFVDRFNVGGVEKSLLALIKALSRDKYDITIGVANRDGGLLGLVPEHVNIIELPAVHYSWNKLLGRPSSVMNSLREGKVIEAWGSFWSIVVAQLSRTLIPHYKYFVNKKTEAGMPEYDIAVSYQGPSEFGDYYISHLIRAKKKFGWIHFDIDRFFVRPKTLRICYPFFDRIFVVSDKAKEVFDRHFPEFADKSEVLLNIIDREENLRLAEEPGIFQPQKDVLNIVTVGRICNQKAQDKAIAAAAIMKKNGIGFKWHFIGAGPEMGEFVELTAQSGVSEEIVFAGALNNPYPYMKGCDVYVQPSRYEGFCIAIGEAKLFGVPIVATDFVGAHEQLDGVPNARIIPEPDPQLIADAIIKASQIGRITPDAPGIPPQIEKLEKYFCVEK